MDDSGFFLKVEELKEGYALWQNILERHEFAARDYVIVFPHEENPVNECGIAHLNQFIQYGREEKRILVLCVGNKVAEMIHLNAREELIKVEILKKEEMEALITLYSIDTISSHFIMMSLTRPYGRYGDKALKKGLTLDEVVTIGIYGMTEKEVLTDILSRKDKGNA